MNSRPSPAKQTSIALTVVLVVAALAYQFFAGASNPPASPTPGGTSSNQPARNSTTPGSNSDRPVTGAGRNPAGWTSRASLETHFEKHGEQFPGFTSDEYLQLAQKLRDAPAGGDILESTRPDGVISRYDRKSGTFIAFNRDGTIRTMFKPADGERYFHRQKSDDR